MARQKTESISMLYEKLGFRKEDPDRQTKVLLVAVKEFRPKFYNKKNIPTERALSAKEADTFASEFCQDSERAENLWPVPFGGASWPSWETEKELILTLLAKFVILQDKNREKALKSKKGNPAQESTIETPDTAAGSNDNLSDPEDIYNAASVSRRPAAVERASIDRATSSKSAQYGFEDGHYHDPSSLEYKQSCLDEIKSLKPQKKRLPVDIFNIVWLRDPNYTWPRAADSRVKIFMHEKNFYQHDMPDNKVLDLSHQLKKGTRLADGFDAQDYNEFAERIKNRVKELASQLVRKGLITDGQKTRQFTEEWDAREHIWSEDLVSPEVVSTPSRDIFDVPDDDNELLNSTPSKPRRPLVLSGMLKKRKNMSLTVPVNIEDNSTTQSENRPKRQKNISSYYPPVATANHTPSSPVNDLQHVESAVKAIAEKFFSEEPESSSNESAASYPSPDPAEDNREVDTFLEHEDVLAMIEEPDIPRLHTPIAQSTTISTSHQNDFANSDTADVQPQTETRLSLGLPTPTSVARFERNVYPTQEYITPINLPRNNRIPSPEIVFPKSLVNLARRPASSSSSLPITPSKVPRKQIELCFQKEARWRNTDSDNTISFSNYISLDIKEFFHQCSERWNLPPDYLDYLVFTICFDQYLPMTILKGDEKAWEILKRDLEESFREVVRESPERKDFVVLVRMERSQIKDWNSRQIIID